MKVKFIPWLLLVVLAAMLLPQTVQADGIIIPDPPLCDPGPCLPVPLDQLVIRYHHVTVTIDNQVAITHVDQVFYNPNDWTIEGMYVFPLPVDAAVTGFTLWIDGKPVEGKVLSADEARRTYEEIVRSMRDPALLEYAGRGAVQARIFPIPSKGERRIELEYTQALAADNGLVRYTYPLNTEKFSQLPLESVSVSLTIHSPEPIRAIYSPSHAVDIQRQGTNAAVAGYEAQNVLPNTDFALYYSVGESEAFHLLTFRDPGDPSDPDGFFLALLAPRPEVSAEPAPKDLLLVLDRSGSMDGEKFVQAQAALRYILSHLNDADRFNVISFSSGIDMFAPGLREAAEAQKAIDWVDRLGAQGSTDINRALLEAVAMMQPEHPTYLIFLTDGLPTMGVTDSAAILTNLAREAPENVRLFAFGVGYDVDTFLLDSLAQEHHGSSTYVQPGEALDEILSGFYARISTPVLTDLELDLGDAEVYDLYPQPLPDLFLGSQIVVVGRYRQPGTYTALLSGSVENVRQSFRYPEQVFTRASTRQDSVLDALPRLWATRKIGYLLNQIRLKGADQETIDQIVRLSIRYGIVTPYTSYLVTEPSALGAENQERIVAEELDRIQSQPTAAPSGKDAVEKAAEQGGMQAAEAPSAPSQEIADQVRIAGSRTFVLSNNIWTDTTFDPQAQQTQKVIFLSDEYFKLLEEHPEVSPALALGERVIVNIDGKAYEVVAGDTGDDTPLKPIATPLPAQEDEPTPIATARPIDFPEVEPASKLPCPAGLIPLGLGLAVVFARRLKR